MGDNFGEGSPRELPVHTVYLDAYYIGNVPVTNGEYGKFMDDGGYENASYWDAGGFGDFEAPRFWSRAVDFGYADSGHAVHGGGIEGNGDFPVVGVSWYEAMAYCAWLSARTGQAYRLPTEAEWEKAARGTDQRRYPWGDEIDGGIANLYRSGDPYDEGPTPVGFYDGSAHGSFQTKDNASPYGAYDMAGNVLEWCYDFYGLYPSGSTVVNPTGPSYCAYDYHIVRGGDWRHAAGDVKSPRSAYRDRDAPFIRSSFSGFRCVRDTARPKKKKVTFEKKAAQSGTESGEAINDGYGDYVHVPAGEFFMGDNFNEGSQREQPVHKVYLDAYYIGKYPMTNGEYKKFMDDGGYSNRSYWDAGGFEDYGAPLFWNCAVDFGYSDAGFPIHGGGIEGNEKFPVVGVSWHEAMAYAAWLSEKTGRTYRLPTEAEWEKAARGTDQRRYPWGGHSENFKDDIDNSYVNCFQSGDPYDDGPTPVGFFDGGIHDGFQTSDNASPYGAYDMAGNVFEWCYDWYGSYPGGELIENPKGPATGQYRVVRGGDWHHPISILIGPRSAHRNDGAPTNRHSNMGFRLAREE
jgi:formylglycine-generating enzyme required for sulfatase activity